MQKYQKLQNLKLKKILKTFKISSITVIKIEVNILSIEIRLNKKNQKLTLRIIKMNNKHSTQLKILWNFLIEYKSSEPPKFSEFFEFSEFTKLSEPINVLKNENSDQFEN